MDKSVSPYLQESSNTIILLKLKINEHDGKITYLYEHFIPDTSLGPQFYWDASNFLHVKDVSGSISQETIVGTAADKRWQYIQRHGFVDNRETSLYYNENSKTLILNVVDGSWNFMQDGSAYNVIEPKSISIPDEFSTPGNYHVYIDNSSGDLNTTFDQLNLIDSKVHVATLIWNESLTPPFQLSDERHQALIDKRIHYHLHNTVGASWISGGDVSSFVIGSSTNMKDSSLVYPISLEFDTSAAWNRISISDTVIVDEDLIINIPALEKPADGSLNYMLYKRTGISNWEWEFTNYPYAYDYAFDGSGYIQWDDLGVLREPSANYFVNSYILYTNIDGSSRYAVIPGQGQYETLKDARTETPIKFNWDGFPIEEFVVGWQLTWETSTCLPTMPGFCTLAIEPKQINLNTRTSLFESFKIYHNSTGGLQGGNDPDEYYHVTKNEKKAIAVITPIVPDIIEAVTSKRWVATDEKFCEFISGYNTGNLITIWKEQEKVPPSTVWKDTGKKEQRKTVNTTECPLVPYRIAASVSRGAFDYSYYKVLSSNYTFGTEIEFTNPIKTGGNSLVISIPKGRKSFSIRNSIADITGKFSCNGTDNVVGYRDNSTYIGVPGFSTAKEVKFYLTVT